MNGPSFPYPKKITAVENSVLLNPVDKEDVREIRFSVHPDEALRPNGFPAKLFQNVWHIIRQDYSKMVEEVRVIVKIGEGINSTFLTFFPAEVNLSAF